MSIKTRVRDVASRLPWRSRRKSWLNATLHCSFCGKSEHEVSKLIAGPSVFICDGCIELCNKIIAAAGGAEVKSHKLDTVESMPTDRLLHWLKVQDVLFEHARAAMQDAVDTLRQREVSWATIGETLGISRQAAWDRFS